jgi:membrane fusion protein (multidrug efflux system)
MKAKSIIIIVVVCIIGAVAWVLVSNKKVVDSKKEVKVFNQEIAVTVVPVEMKTPSAMLELTGLANANRDVAIATDIAGKITQVNFKLGDYVSQGKVLAKVDDAYKKLALDNAQLNYNKNKEDYERYQILRKGDAVSETQLRDMKLSFENAGIQLENAKKQFNDTRIVAPFSGHITSQNVELGAYVNVGNTVAKMVDISQLKVSLMVSEGNVYQLRTGQPVNITTSVYPDATYNGTISHISPQGSNFHTYPVEIMIANNKQFPLKAGTYVNTHINLGNSTPALMIPRDAIVSSVKDPSVYLVKGDVVQLVKINTGRDSDSYLEVLSGLNEGDLVVTNGQINLMDGAKVTINKN